MAATKGNRFWEARSTHGRKPIFAHPDLLWSACVEYFEWNEDNPLIAFEPNRYQGNMQLDEIPKMRAMTLSALCMFLDITDVTWREYRKLEDFSGVCFAAEDVIKNQKFSGAAGGFLNPMIIARDLGLKDQTSNEHTGRNGGPIQNVNVELTEESAAVAYKDMMEGDQ